MFSQFTTSYRAIKVKKSEHNFFYVEVDFFSLNKLISQIENGDVVIKNQFSGLNFKDVMSASGNPAVTRHFPHVPGIDAAGNVVASKNVDFPIGSEVIAYAREMGMNKSGGFSEFVLLKKDWIEPKPKNLSLKQCMIIGTAGFTAALAVQTIDDFIDNNEGVRILVDGATGSVGSIVIHMLSNLGYSVSALTSGFKNDDFLLSIGAKEIIYSDSFLSKLGSQNLLPENFDAIVDVLGGDVLSKLVKIIKKDGIGVLLGMVKGTSFEANVLPFILRGVSLIGLNAENKSNEYRTLVWNKISSSYLTPEIPKILYSSVGLTSFAAMLNSMITHDFSSDQKVGKIILDFNLD